MNSDNELEPTNRYGEVPLDEVVKRQGVQLYVLMNGEFKDMPRNRAERRAAEEQLVSIARMQIREKMKGWGGKKAVVA